MDILPGATGKLLDDALIHEFAGRFRGEVVLPDSPNYDEARKVFNGMIDKRPALIARCAGVADVMAAVVFARANELTVAVRGGGHSIPGYGTCDGGIVMDLSPMKGMWVDPDAQTARAQAGLTWGEFDRETQQFGLAVTGGRITHTGIAGLTLGSGSGWLERKYGLTCDNLLSVEMVSAEGEFVRASESENEELFWGLRGGGGNFGVVASFEYRLHPVGPIVLGGMLLHPFEKAGELLRFWRDYIEDAPDEFGSAPAFLTAPPAPFVPDHMKGKLVAGLIVCYAGSPEEGEEVIRPLKEFGPPFVDLVQPMPYTVVQTLVDETSPPGRCNYWKAENMGALSDAAIDALVDQASMMPLPFSVILLEPKGRAISRVGEDEMAMGGRDAAHTVYAIAAWDDPAETDAHVGWARGLAEAMAPHAIPGVSLNFTMDQDEGRMKSFFRGGKYERLVALKNKYDPTNFFRLNQNIKPAEKS